MPPSFTPPFTSSGRSALVQAPPWHYAGWLLNVEFAFDAGLGAAMVPPELGVATGKGCVHFADWQSCGNDGQELLDPVYAQYRETIVVLEIAPGQGADAHFYCPLIYVDQDISMLRGWLQGWPKKIGQTWLTRSLPLEHPAAAPLSNGSRLGASLSVKERRLVDATVTLTDEKAGRLGFLSAPTIGAVGWPDLTQPGIPAAARYLRADIVDRVESGWTQGRATLRFHEHPVEELSLLGRVEATQASAGWMGITVHGALAA
ncbi:acetoacetate decarboxylase family protein [Variovorax paradoxus]|uniref:acetoacetate decarboxylase family protein n=1 Tax=Variovorax paradoxus TaxID=34073 RepID=UPI003D648E2C